jgi:hypothetical protein
VNRIELAQNVAQCEDGYEFWDSIPRDRVAGAAEQQPPAAAGLALHVALTSRLTKAENLRFTGNPDFYKVTTCFWRVGAQAELPPPQGGTATIWGTDG